MTLSEIKFQYGDTVPTRTMKLETLRLALLDISDRHRNGEGSPEGVVEAPVGTIYTRSDGGAGTTLYVKEVGTDEFGWAAK